MYEIRRRKNEIREKYKALRRAIEPEKKALMDEKICAGFMGSVTFRYASVLLFYAPKGDEVDVMPAVRRALADGKKVAFPRCIPDTHDMDYHFIEDLSQLERGSYGIMEPRAELPVYDRSSTESAACVVPALVYDRNGYRLGYGKGYYDRYLGSFTGAKVGFIYSDFVVDKLPRGRFDLAVDFIVSERGIQVI